MKRIIALSVVVVAPVVAGLPRLGGHSCSGRGGC